MNIYTDLLKSIKEDSPVQEVRRGLHWTAVVSKRCGLASTIATGGCSQGKAEGREGSFSKMSAIELAHYSVDTDISKMSLGLAAINSLIDIDPEHKSNVDGLHLVKKIGRGKNISVIGHFPHLDSLAEEAKNLWIIEKNPGPGDHPEDKGKELIPQSDIVVITSTTLINKSLSGILSLCKNDSIKMLLGPSTPLSPVLFDYGIDILSGSIVTENDVVLKSVSEGASFMQLKRNGGVRFVSIMKDNDYIKKFT